MAPKKIAALLLLALFLFYLPACGDDDDDNDSSDPVNDDANDDVDDDTDDDLNDDIDDDSDDDLNDDVDDDADDDVDDDIDDDDTIIPPTPNENAKADAFKLFYKERAARTIMSLNRYSFSGDAVMGNSFLAVAIAKDGNEYEVVPGPEGNNFFGFSAFVTWKLYQAIGGRNLELSLIRMFEGLAFNEAVSGHPGLTTREAFPGWTRTMDGVAGTVARTKWGNPVIPPVTYDAALEQEILDTFYDGLIFTYRENPEEYLFNFKAVHELTTFATTYVFDELDHDPPFMRVSDCCSSFMVSQKGIWEGAYWGNQNSRDNFTDYAMGFLAAFDAEATDGLPADLAEAAHNAAEAGRRTGDTTIEHNSVLMTVDEWHDYETLTPAGEMNPDGEVEWQDLGSLAACQAAYLAQAVSTEGLSWPVPELPLARSIETDVIKLLFSELGLPEPTLPMVTCRDLDAAIIGINWGDVLDFEIFNRPWIEIARFIETIFPGVFADLLGGMMDDFVELELGTVGLCYYAQAKGDDQLFHAAQQTLNHFVQLQKILTELVYGIVADPAARREFAGGLDDRRLQAALRSADDMLYRAATYSRMFGIDSPLENFGSFRLGDERTTYIESFLDLDDTLPHPLLTDQDIFDQVEARLVNRQDRAPWIVERYRDRFDYTPPVRRAGDGYECVATMGPPEVWQPTENPRHVWFKDFRLWFEAPLCVFSPETLDCAWAKLGCAPADFDDSGLVDDADRTLFDAAWATHGEGALCDDANAWCDGADLDQSGLLNAEDQAFMDAAAGCVR
jgi:hypothetical protein